MKKDINIKKLYLFTFLSFILILLFLYLFSQKAPYFYTGFDYHTIPNRLSKLANFTFIILILINFICVLLSIFYSIKIIFNKIK
ncbi:hypothetical protein Curi_c13560 [Gottschalkia acidurici 9a]|uniref:Uncharacterized protein n=1 Tax=Gottschalkia acidurici (strain ATCC 7906 / DSM 604 / BCRC 14475 / CIP 104303 / KCTC 5404 / NCIMB 10678 / 9a) TaxID=1128398 RepID=K0B152_GOTA9|nr:hypothetical protein Curi_c13560 [Gottschalkia acidurici 9a]